MAQVINTNMMSLMAKNNLNKSQNALSTSIQRLSTGLRINGAKDDAAGQGIANRFTSQIRGLTQAARNANDGLSMAQTIEGGMNEINENLQRMRELTVQALNSTNSKADLDSINDEITKRINEISRIYDQVDFNGIKVLKGKATVGASSTTYADGNISFQVGSNDEETVSIFLKKMDLKALKLEDGPATPPAAASKGFTTLFKAFMNPASPDHGTSTNKLLGALDASIAVVDKYRGELGAFQNVMESTVNELNGRINNLTASRSRIEDADYATEVSNMTRAQILQQAGTSVLAQANQVPQTVLSLLQS